MSKRLSLVLILSSITLATPFAWAKQEAIKIASVADLQDAIKPGAAYSGTYHDAGLSDGSGKQACQIKSSLENNGGFTVELFDFNGHSMGKKTLLKSFVAKPGTGTDGGISFYAGGSSSPELTVWVTQGKHRGSVSVKWNTSKSTVACYNAE